MTRTRAADGPTCTIDPFDEGVLADPYPMHEALRDLGPVVRLEAHRVWALTRYEQVHAALNDPETFASSAGVGLSDFRKEKPWRAPSLLIEADPPQHTRARHVVTKVLSPPAVRALRQDFQTEATALFDRIGTSGRIDGVRDIAEPFPLKVFPDAVGISDQGRENLLPYGSMVFNSYGPRGNRLFARATAAGEAVDQWISDQCRPEHLAAGGLGQRVHTVAAQEGLDPKDSALLVRSLLSAGVDTTVHGLGNALFMLAENPEQYDLLRDDPSLARAAFEEAIRLESPVQTFFRTTTRDVQIEDITIPGGEKVLLFFGAANRDPRRWTDAGRFDIRRPVSGHVGFGSGIHACVGMMMARLEGEVVLGELARRVVGLEISGPVERQISNTLRGLDSLPLTITHAT